MSGPMLQKAVLRPRMGFLGVGWIGRNRMEAIVRSGAVDVAAVVDPLRAREEGFTYFGIGHE